MTERPRAGTFAPFRYRSFRFQWPADLMTSWALEMETLILGWYVLTATGSVVWLSVFGASQFMGTLISPMFGVMGDRLGQRRVLLAMRATYAALAAVLAVLDLTGQLHPAPVFVIAGLSGLVRPSDIGMRNALIGATMPPAALMGAMGISRMSADSARVIGALSGAALADWLGFGRAYALLTLLYLASLPLVLQVDERRAPPASPRPLTSPWRDLADGFAYVRRAPVLLASLALAFLMNFSAYPISGGLLPHVAHDVFGLDRTGLGYLSASFGLGALLGSLTISATVRRLPPARTMLAAAALWLPLLMVFANLRSPGLGKVLLFAIGFVQSFCMVPMAALLLRMPSPSYRGRVMGLRMLAVYGLPLGLLLVGAMTAWLGFSLAAMLLAGFGLVLTCAIALGWRVALLPAGAPANERVA
ncbi:MAG: MFS transporter [Acetobacteraceae bacterium]|jgi:predicted MFS family arabinose efflux permease|nr:MFS transporter [Acetobacteraceae bacterium]